MPFPGKVGCANAMAPLPARHAGGLPIIQNSIRVIEGRPADNLGHDFFKGRRRRSASHEVVRRFIDDHAAENDGMVGGQKADE